MHIKNELKARERPQRIKVLATKPEGLSSLPGTHIIERERELPTVVLWPL